MNLYSDVFNASDAEFIRYVSRFGKSYTSKDEFLQRSALFKASLERVMSFNSQNEGRTYWLGLNKFADWTPEEYRQLLGYKGSAAEGM